MKITILLATLAILAFRAINSSIPADPQDASVNAIAAYAQIHVTVSTDTMFVSKAHSRQSTGNYDAQIALQRLTNVQIKELAQKLVTDPPTIASNCIERNYQSKFNDGFGSMNNSPF